MCRGGSRRTQGSGGARSPRRAEPRAAIAAQPRARRPRPRFTPARRSPRCCLGVRRQQRTDKPPRQREGRPLGELYTPLKKCHAPPPTAPMPNAPPMSSRMRSGHGSRLQWRRGRTQAVREGAQEAAPRPQTARGRRRRRTRGPPTSLSPSYVCSCTVGRREAAVLTTVTQARASLERERGRCAVRRATSLCRRNVDQRRRHPATAGSLRAEPEWRCWAGRRWRCRAARAAVCCWRRARCRGDRRGAGPHALRSRRPRRPRELQVSPARAALPKPAGQ